MKPNAKLFVPALAVIALLVTGASAAAPPPNVAGTTWAVQANRDVETLTITNQGGAGAPGASICRVILGTIGIAPIRGWYCPSTGRIHFRHNNISTGATVRVFTGNVSDQVPGQSLFMGGTMAIDNAAFGNLGEYNFSAVN